MLKSSCRDLLLNKTQPNTYKLPPDFLVYKRMLLLRRLLFIVSCLCSVFCIVPNANAQIAITGVAFNSGGAFVDASLYPTIRVRVRVTRNNQPIAVRDSSVYLIESNVNVRPQSVVSESGGVYTITYITSQFDVDGAIRPTRVLGAPKLFIYAGGDVGSLPLSWSVTPGRGGNISVLDGDLRAVPFFINFGDVVFDRVEQLSVRASQVTLDASGNERTLRLESIRTNGNNFRIVWQASHGSSPPPTLLQSGSSYRFDLTCTPRRRGAISEVMTLYYEGGMHTDVLLFANTPVYLPSKVLELISPNGGEKLTPCQDVPISWKGSIVGFPSHVELSTDNGKTWSFIDSTLDTTVIWTVPAKITDSARIRVYQKTGASGSRWLQGVNAPATNLAFSASGRHLAVAFGNGEIREWDLVTYAITNSYSAENVTLPFSRITSLAYVGTSRDLVAYVDHLEPEPDNLQMFRSGSNSPQAQKRLEISSATEIGTDSSGLSVFVMGSMGGSVLVYDANTLNERSSIVLSAPATTARASNGMISVAQIDGDVVQYALRDGREVSRVKTQLSEMGGPIAHKVTVSKSGRLIGWAGLSASSSIVSAPEQRTIVFDAVANSVIAISYRVGLDAVGIDFNASESFLSIGLPGSPQIRQYDIEKRTLNSLIPGMPGHTNLMTDLEYGPDGSTLASCSADLSNNVLVRRLISPELDQSDAPFQILRIQLSTPGVNFGTVRVGSVLDTVITASFCNTGSVPAIFDRANLLSGSWCTVMDTLVGDTLAPGECMRVRFSCLPLDTGEFRDTLELVSCNVRFLVPIALRSIDRKLTTLIASANLGDICVNDTVGRRIMVIRNDDEVPTKIDGIVMQKALESQFEIRGFTPGTILNPGSSIEIELLFKPVRLGLDTDAVVVWYAGQVSVSRSIIVYGRGAGADVSLSHNVLPFISGISDRTVLIRNRSQNQVILQSVAFSSGAPFVVLTQLPLTVGANDSADLEIRYDGSTIGDTDFASLTFVPCTPRSRLRLTRYTGTSTIYAPVVQADPRGDATIPIVASVKEVDPYKGLRPFEGVLMVNPRLFLAREISTSIGTAEIVSQNIVDGLRQIRYRVEGSFPDSATIAVLTGPAGLAEVDSAVLSHDTLAVSFGPTVQVQYADGLLRIINPDPSRRIVHPSQPVIRSVHPNPATQHATLSIASPHSLAATITILDQHGATYSSRSIELPTGDSIVSVDVGSLQSGAYLIVLNGGEKPSTITVVVVR